MLLNVLNFKDIYVPTNHSFIKYSFILIYKFRFLVQVPIGENIFDYVIF